MCKYINYLIAMLFLAVYSITSYAIVCEDSVIVDGLSVDEVKPNTLMVYYTKRNVAPENAYKYMYQDSAFNLTTPAGRAVLSLLEIAMDQLYPVIIYGTPGVVGTPCATFQGVVLKTQRMSTHNYVRRQGPV